MNVEEEVARLGLFGFYARALLVMLIVTLAWVFFRG